MADSLPVLAGTVSTVLFVASYLPMLVKARRTRDLSSYSVGNLVIGNVGNAVHSVYVFSLPAGPIWALHAFYLAATALMLWWYARYRRRWAAVGVPVRAAVTSLHHGVCTGDPDTLGHRAVRVHDGLLRRDRRHLPTGAGVDAPDPEPACSGVH